MIRQRATTARATIRRMAVPGFVLGLVALSLGTSLRPAIAGTVSNSGALIQYTAAPDEVNNVFAFQSGTNLVLWDQGTLDGSPITVTPAGGCAVITIDNPNDAALCPDGSVPALFIALGDRNDILTVDASVSGHLAAISVDGGTGDDSLTNLSSVSAIASYSSATNGVTVDLSVTSPQNTGEGNDSLSGFRNLFGSGFDDILSGDANANSLNGGAGNDTLAGRTGDDVLSGGTGVNTASYTTASGGVSVDLNITGPQAIGGGEGTDTLGSAISNVLGSSFGDTLDGNTGQNTLNGRGGDDSLDGGSNDDTLIGGSGNDVITGGGGTDTAEYSDSFVGVTVDLSNGGSQNTGDGFDTLSGISNLTGSSRDDTLLGDGGDNRLTGGAGNDQLFGRGGSDVLDGGVGVNTANYSLSAASATIDLAAGQASPDGDGGADTILNVQNVVGTSTGDDIVGDALANTIQSGGGADVVAGAGGDDTLDGGTGQDEVTYSFVGGTSYPGSSNPVTVNLAAGTAVGEGTDSLAGFETATGSALADTLIPGSGGSTLQGAAGNDTLVASGGGSEVLDGGGGSDTVDYSGAHAGVNVDLRSGFANDGDGGFDILVLNSVENVTGSPFNDTIQSGGGADVVVGAGGDDTLDGGTGQDEDTYSFVGGTSYPGSSNPVTVNLSAGTAVGEGTDSLAGFETATGSALADTLIPGSSGSTLQGATGNDTLVASGGGSDVLDGGGGSDTVDYSGAHAGVNVDLRSGFADDGDGGFDVLVLNSIENVTGSSFNDTIQGDGNGNQLNGGSGTDTVSYSGVFFGVTIDLKNGTAAGDGSDTLSGFENATGSGGPDVITGSDGPNVLSGANGGDSITGGLGSDTISGGPGDDTINAKDKVADTVTCGDDTDSVTKDSLDSVALDCELVNVSAPKAVTGAASSITGNGATLTATVNAHGQTATVYFEYGLKKRTYGMTTSSVIVKGKRNVPVAIGITGLTPDTTYHFRVVAVNAIGTTYGHDSIFVTSH